MLRATALVWSPCSLKRVVLRRMTSSRRRWAHESSECGGEGERAPEARKELAPSPEWVLREEGGGNLWWLKRRDPKHIPEGGGESTFFRGIQAHPRPLQSWCRSLESGLGKRGRMLGTNYTKARGRSSQSCEIPELEVVEMENAINRELGR